ncbi:MAG: hypothetical protein EA369_02460 [Bradymonadales bacterium]|nr:MAG: hypothetical protein EA369_02460 [Bradymonadales bacterium]
MRVLFLFLISFLSISCAQRLDEFEARLNDLDERSRFLEGRSGVPSGSSEPDVLEGRRLADLRSQLTTIRNDQTVMRGQIESLEYQNQALQDRIQQMESQVSRAQRSPRSQRGNEAARGPDGLYREALRAHQTGNFDRARLLFLRFLEERPEDPLADNALFWVAEGHRLQGQHAEALVRYQDLIENYPQSDKRCDAMARQADSFRNLGMEAELEAFTEIMNAECPTE